jgi:4-amino-4-deoxychorismate lyase
MTESLGSWVDGKVAAAIPLDDRGLQYGDGLFETLLLRAGKPRFLEQHLARLAHGCARLGIPFDSMDELRSDIAHATAMAPALAVLKVIVTRGSSARRGYSPHGAGTPRRIVSLFATSTLAAEARAGARLRLAESRLAENPALAGLKHLNRLENVLAAGEPEHTGVFESLLRDLDDNVVCGTMSNVFLVIGNQVITPPVDRCGVAGVMRAVVLRECPRLGIAVQIRRVAAAELTRADEVFVTNARIGVVAAQSLGEHRFNMNTVALKLAAHIEKLDA